MKTQQLIIDWGKAKGIVFAGNETKQYLKFCEEKGELAAEILKGNLDKAKMELGDCIVTVTLLAACLGCSIGDHVTLVRHKVDHQAISVGLMNLESKSGTLADELILTKSPFLDGEISGVFFALNILASLLDSSFDECAELAYNKISKRTGENVGGVFVKA